MRGRLHHDPRRLHRSLCDLSRRCDAQVRVKPTPLQEQSNLPQWLFASTRAARPAVEWFAEQVAGELDGGMIRYSQRLSLLRAAADAGIGRFEANLIIAAIQHRSKDCPITDQSPRKYNWENAITFIAVQLIILTGTWWFLGA